MEVFQIKSKFFDGSFDQNSYIVHNKNEYVLIDAGAEIEDIEKILKNKKLSAIFITHAHFDHIFNLEKIEEHFGCDVYLCEGAEEKFNNFKSNASFLFGQNITIDASKIKIKHYKEEIHLKNIIVKVFKTLGHSSDGVCLLIDKYLFTGDTVFIDTIGRCDFSDSSVSDMENSLRLIKNIDFEIACPGHFEMATKQQIVKVIDSFIH